MKIRSATLNGKTYLLREDVTRALAPFHLAVTESGLPGLDATPARIAKALAKPKAKRRTKAELQAAVRALAPANMEAIARKLGISLATVEKLALVAKE